jgi:hypothetical protein
VLAVAVILGLVLFIGVGAVAAWGVGLLLLTGLAMVFSGIFTHWAEKAYNAIPELKCPACQYETRDGRDDVADHLQSSHHWTKETTDEWIEQAETLLYGKNQQRANGQA